jgi:alpha-beta hydrolase superfamily lysophospholipase
LRFSEYTLSSHCAVAELAGLICESFAHELPAPDFALAVFKGLGHLAPHAHILHLPNERFSRDAKVVEAMNEDPLIAHETQPTRTMAALVRADERLKKEFPLITLPVLILHGTWTRTRSPARASTLSLQEIAGELNVDAVVEGTVVRSGDRVRVT